MERKTEKKKERNDERKRERKKERKKEVKKSMKGKFFKSPDEFGLESLNAESSSIPVFTS